MGQRKLETKLEAVEVPVEALPEYLSLDLDERTTSCLDFDVVLGEVESLSITSRGKEMALVSSYVSAEEVSSAYLMVEELMPQLEVVPLRTSMNAWDMLRMIERGTQPERDDMVAFAGVVAEVGELVEFLLESADKMPLTSALAADMLLPMELVESFDGAFDNEGNLSEEKYPGVAELRKTTQLLQASIVQTIKGLLSSPAMADKLADSGYLEMEGRYCIMLKNTHKRGLGIVHGSSNTGRSIYVEPSEVVQTTNDLKLAQMELRKEENAVFFKMCKTIAANRDSIVQSMTSVGQLDVMRAKAALGVRIKGVIPEVGTEGVVHCVDARHPVLVMHGVETVGNSIDLNADAPGLVISGPNAGGKTIVLKTIGLFALMVQHAIPIPARPGARVDQLDVMADIGDMQTVSGNLSTFSGHLVVCREMMKRAKDGGGEAHHPLILLDEIGTGTDPAQGAVLAQAVLEELVACHARIIVTTHYQRVKELAVAANEGSSLLSSFRIAAMEFLDNRPTYRLRMGSVGESFALEAGERIGLPTHVLVRAESLLDDETRRLVALQQRLEEEVALARKGQVAAADIATALEAERASMEDDRRSLAEELACVRDGATEKYLVHVKEKERIIEHLVEDAKRAAALGDARGVEAVRIAVKETRIETEGDMVAAVVAAEDIATVLVAGEPVEVGTALIVLEKGNLFGVRGIVTRRNKGRGRVLMRVAGAEVKFERHLLGIHTNKNGLIGKGRSGGVIGGGAMKDFLKMSAKDKRLFEMLETELVDPEQMLKTRRRAKENPRAGLRMKSNTLDARNLGLEELRPRAMAFLEHIVSKNEVGVLYVNHGNTKSAEFVKVKARSWLKKHPLVRSVRGANASEGGDSYTYVELDFGG
jgi:DNA mismatch repair protein MutS2